MAKIEKNKLTKEMIEKALACKDADELMTAAKAAAFGKFCRSFLSHNKTAHS